MVVADNAEWIGTLTRGPFVGPDTSRTTSGGDGACACR